MDSTQRRRRRIGRAVRDKTPEPNLAQIRKKASEDESSQIGTTTTASEEGNAIVQVLRMQIRPPGTMSAHESKILRKRDKTFATSAARSLSQPREAERLTSPEADNLIRTVKRSLSSPRHKEESSETEFGNSQQTKQPNGSVSKEKSENLSRLEQNLHRFEEERKRFESDKRHFEREKREHKLRYRHMFDSGDERMRLLQNYRKLSDRTQFPVDADERQRFAHSLRLQRPDPAKPMYKRSTGYDESSTQFSSSDADTAEEIIAKRLVKRLSPVRRNVSAAAAHMVSVRGPPPEPPKVPERRTVSRNNSLSPIRPQRRSKTPEQRMENIKKLDVSADLNGSSLSASVPAQAKAPTTFENNEKEAETNDLSAVQLNQRRKKSLQNEFSESTQENQTTKSNPPQIKVETKQQGNTLSSVFAKLKTIFSKKMISNTNELKGGKQNIILNSTPSTDKIFSKVFLRHLYAEARYQWAILKSQYPKEISETRRLRNKCIVHTIMLVMLCGFGGLMFRYTEGAAENIYKCEVRKVKRDFIDNLWTVSHNMREDDWKSLARQKLRNFEEELHELQELGIRRKTGMKSWNFVNCILYCWTIISTIGYGHITPQTVLGRSLTIIYAIIGIPMFLILLADFGKLFTRALKFLWAYVRRLYYTGTCRKIRKQQQVRDAMSGFNTMYEAAIRRQSQFFGMAGDAEIDSQTSEAIKSGVHLSHPETPSSPYPETFEIDDEFNLPVSVASILLISYIVFGAFVYTLWEDWSYFEAFYFVFISMSTIGFGDFVPNHPIFMMCSIIYLVFGLALTSMFINVVQIKLSDTFKQASSKIGATIGLGLASELGDEAGSHLKTPSELASIHGSRLGKIQEDLIEQRSVPTPPLNSILRPARPVSPQVYYENGNDVDIEPPALVPRRQVSMEQQSDLEKKKKKRFFK